MLALKILTTLLLLPAITLLGMLLGFSLVLLSRLRRIGIFLFLLSASSLWVLATPAVSNAVMGSLENSYPRQPAQALPRADAIVVLGGGITPTAPPSSRTYLSSSSAVRTAYGAILYRAGKAPWIIVSGGAMPWRSELQTEAATMRTFLTDLGIPDSAVMLQARGRNTRESAHFIHELISERGLHRVLLVTSASHMQRALADFRAQDVDAAPAPDDYDATEGQPLTMLDILPNADALSRSSRAIKEYLGIGYQKLFGAG